MPELDMHTLFWVLTKDCEVNHKIWDLREAIQNEIEKQLDAERESLLGKSELSSSVRYEATNILDQSIQLKKEQDVKEEINIHG